MNKEFYLIEQVTELEYVVDSPRANIDNMYTLIQATHDDDFIEEMAAFLDMLARRIQIGM